MRLIEKAIALLLILFGLILICLPILDPEREIMIIHPAPPEQSGIPPSFVTVGLSPILAAIGVVPIVFCLVFVYYIRKRSQK